MASHVRVTRVDLSSGQVSEEIIPEGYLKFIGGRGIGAYLLLRDLKARTDPLSPANELIMMPGAAVGNGITGANRITFVTKSPHDTCSFSHAGGTIATALRRNGVECLVITGRAAAPVYLLIADGKISIREAAHIWGKTTGETDAALRNELGSDIIVGCIGAGGENLIPFASFVMERIHVSAKGGAGCVAGSKNLKAIAVRKSGDIPKSSRREAISKYILKNLQSSPSTKLWKEFGTLNLVVTNYNRGNLAAFNYMHNNSEEGLEAYKPEAFLPFKEGRHSCYRCPVGCSQVYRLQSEAHKGLMSKIEWGTLDALGPLLGIFSYESVCEMQGLCNQYGVDAKEIGSVLGMAIECYEKGIIGPQHTGGIELKWGDFETARQMVELTVRREGFGEILSKGIIEAAKEIGGDALKYAMGAKGSGIAGIDVRTELSWALGHAVATRGPDCQSHFAVISRGNKKELAKQLFDEEAAADRLSPVGKGRMVWWSENYKAIVDGLGLCNFIVYHCMNPSPQPLEVLAEVLGAVTDEQVSVEDLFLAGERIALLNRAFNLREGFRRKDDTLPERFLNVPTPDGPVGLTVPLSHPGMLDEYYIWRGCDEDGLITQQRISEAGLSDVAAFSNLGYTPAAEARISLHEVLPRVTNMNISMKEGESEGYWRNDRYARSNMNISTKEEESEAL